MNSSEKQIAQVRREAIRKGDRQTEVACDMHQLRLDELKEKKIWMNDSEFEHTGHYGTKLTGLCDFSTGVVITRPNSISNEHFVQDIMEIAAWHAMHIHSHLNGFQGYDCIGIVLRAEAADEAAEDIKQWQCHAGDNCGRWNMAVSTTCGKCGARRPK